MRTMLVLLCTGLVMFGCARVKVEGSKEPIKLDISMRLDIYQHVEKDINSIEDIVSGAQEPADKLQKTMFNFLVRDAYAQEALPQEVQEAALRRKERKQALADLMGKGIIGENSNGLVELRQAGAASANDLIVQENNDRMAIYQALAQKNNAPVAQIQKLYSQRLQKDAPSGTPIEVNAGDWQVK